RREVGGECGGGKVGGDLETAGAASAQGASPVEGESLVAHVAELPAACDRPRRGRGLVSPCNQSILERSFGEPRAGKQPGSDVERRGIVLTPSSGAVAVACTSRPGQSRPVRALRPPSATRSPSPPPAPLAPLELAVSVSAD